MSWKADLDYIESLEGTRDGSNGLFAEALVLWFIALFIFGVVFHEEVNTFCKEQGLKWCYTPTKEVEK